MLTAWRDSDIQAIKKLGFRIAAKDQGRKVLIGTIAVAKLTDLAQVWTVRKVFPLQP